MSIINETTDICQAFNCVRWRIWNRGIGNKCRHVKVCILIGHTLFFYSSLKKLERERIEA